MSIRKPARERSFEVSRQSTFRSIFRSGFHGLPKTGRGKQLPSTAAGFRSSIRRPMTSTRFRRRLSGALTEALWSRFTILSERFLLRRSKQCHLYGLSDNEVMARGECPLDPGGYFVIDGTEKVSRILLRSKFWGFRAEFSA